MKLLITTLTMIVISFSSMAENFYIGVSTGQTSFDTGVTAVVGSTLEEESNTNSFFIGKKINKKVSLEGFYTDLGKATLTANSGSTFNSHYGTITFGGGASSTLETSSNTFGLAVKYEFVNDEKASLFFKAGFHSYETELKALRGTITLGSIKYDGTDTIIGLGSEYKINEKISLIVGYDAYQLGSSNVSYLHIGSKYIF